MFGKRKLEARIDQLELRLNSMLHSELDMLEVIVTSLGADALTPKLREYYEGTRELKKELDAVFSRQTKGH